jgi:hypothetical protein
MHFCMVTEIPTNAFNNYLLLYEHAPTCFGALKRHPQGARSDPDEIVNTKERRRTKDRDRLWMCSVEISKFEYNSNSANIIVYNLLNLLN